MDDTPTATAPAETQEALTVVTPKDEKKLEGIEHDPYEWGKCAVTANILWLPDGSVLLGIRNHLDAPLISVLSGEALVTLAGHAAELPIPSVETIADLLAQLREDLPLRAQAKTERDETARRKAEAAQTKPTSGKKTAKPATAAHAIQPATASVSTPNSLPAKLPPVGKAPAATQVSLFNFMTGGN